MAILPLRIEDVPLDEELEHNLSSVHWMDAMTLPLEAHLNMMTASPCPSIRCRGHESLPGSFYTR